MSIVKHNGKHLSSHPRLDKRWRVCFTLGMDNNDYCESECECPACASERLMDILNDMKDRSRES
jgi:hypothetical protein